MLRATPGVVLSETKEVDWFGWLFFPFLCNFPPWCGLCSCTGGDGASQPCALAKPLQTQLQCEDLVLGVWGMKWKELSFTCRPQLKLGGHMHLLLLVSLSGFDLEFAGRENEI